MIGPSRPTEEPVPIAKHMVKRESDQTHANARRTESLA